MNFLTIIFLSLITTPSHAANFCAEPERVFERVESCEENDLFVDQAEDCLESLEKLVSAEKAKMKFSADKSKNQSKTVSTAASDYKLTMATLDRLIAQAKLAGDDVHTYMALTVLPEDFEEPEINGGDEEAFANSVPCFGETKESLGGVLKDIDDITAELEAAKLASSNLKSGSDANVGTIDSANQKAAADLNMQSQNTGDASATKTKGSSISGTITDGKSKKTQEAPKK